MKKWCNGSLLGDRLCCLPRRFPPTYEKYASGLGKSKKLLVGTSPRLSSKGLAVTGGRVVTKWFFLLLSFPLLTSCSSSHFEGIKAQSEIMVYSSRKEHLIQPVFKAFTEATGIKVKYLTDKAGPLIQKLEREGEESPADIFMTVDAGNLYLANKKNLFQSISSEKLDQNIPSFLKDPKNYWFGFSKRARVIFYNPQKVDVKELSTYEDLASSKWQNRLCLRTSKKVYNQSLVATMIAHNGEKKTEKVIHSWVRNLAAPVFSSDSRLLQAIGSGHCHVGVANTYYYGQLLKKKPKIPVKIFWPNQNGRGIHINISGAGVVKSSKNPVLAQRLLEWLSEPAAQKLFVEANMEYPVNPLVNPSSFLKNFGAFKSDQIEIIKAGVLQSQAVRLMDRAGYH